MWFSRVKHKKNVGMRKVQRFNTKDSNYDKDEIAIELRFSRLVTTLKFKIQVTNNQFELAL